MKLYKHNNGYGEVAINVKAISHIWADGDFCILFALIGAQRIFSIECDSKGHRDMALNEIIKMMEDES